MATRAVSLSAGHTARVVLRLNAAGTRLLAQRRRLTTSLLTSQKTARGHAATLAARTVVFHRAHAAAAWALNAPAAQTQPKNG